MLSAKGPKGFEPLTWWSEATRTIQAMQRVQTIKNLTIVNNWNELLGYSGNIYDIKTATKDGVIYPSMDPSIFEVKYPNKDIKARIVGY